MYPVGHLAFGNDIPGLADRKVIEDHTLDPVDITAFESNPDCFPAPETFEPAAESNVP